MTSRLLVLALTFGLLSPGARAADPAPPATTAAQRYGTWGIDLAGMDRSVKPGDDFFRYANGKWAAATQIPPDRTSYGAFVILRDLSEARVRALLDRWAADKTLKAGSDEVKVATIYRTFLDDAAAEKLDAKPIQPYLDAIRKAESHADLAAVMARTEAVVGRSFVNAGVSDDAKNPDRYALYLSQSGLGLADREFYLKKDYEPQKERYFKEAGIEKADRAVVRQNTAFPKLAAIFADTPVATLRAWHAFGVADAAAPLLSKRFVDANWEFRQKFLNGAQEQRARWKRAVDAAEGSMGEAIGRTYVAEYFPPESKAKMEKLVADLRTAMKGRIENLQWMGPETKARALEKLSKFGVKIGYPFKWRDYSALVIREGDLVGNAERAAKFEWAYDVSRIGKPVDELEWGMTPQTVNAYYASVKNEIVFPAAILQPPFFDPKADPAVNYGAIGGVIGHEITHGFDDQGRKSDGDGMLRDWWAPEDAAKFEAQATKLGAQYEAYKFPQLPGLHITARLTMGENIGDLGGILLGLDAYKRSLNGEPAPVMDGFTGEQRVFLGWAQVWRSLMRDDALRQYLATNTHSPGSIRAFAPLRNVDAWYEAFAVKEGDANYIKPEDRVRIW